MPLRAVVSKRPRLGSIAARHRELLTNASEQGGTMSAPNVNSVTLVGQLTDDPVLRAMPDGRSVCDLRLAVNDHRDKPALFIDVATFGAGADACAEHLCKGGSVAVV